MEKQTVFIKRYPSKGELPSKNGYYLTQVGVVHFRGWFNNWIEYWLEEIELPSEEEIYSESKSKGDWYDIDNFIKGANFILNKLGISKNNSE